MFLRFPIERSTMTSMTITPVVPLRPRRAVTALLAVVLAFAMSGSPAFLTPEQAAATASTVRTTKTVQYVTTPDRLQATIDACDGPAAIRTGVASAPWLLAEHNHCGGQWALSTRKGDLLAIKNGTLAGRWRANGDFLVVQQGASVAQAAGLGELVVQTCYFGSNKMRLVGFSRVSK